MKPSHPSYGRGLAGMARRLPFTLLLLAAGACTTPRFVDAGGPDAGDEPEQEAGVDPRWERWIGRYASRAFFFGIDGVLRPSAQQLSVVEIKPRGEKLVLEQQLCLYEGVVSFVLEGYLRYEFPSDLPPVTAELTVDSASFSSEWASYTLGFQADAPPACASADRLPARLAQSGLSGTCVCPSEANSALPDRSDDCRVTDPDHDGKAGVAIELLVSGELWTYEALQRVRLRYLNGYRGRNGLYADLDTGATTKVLDCVETDFTPGCELHDPTPCPAKYNKTEFVPIDDDYDCARVVAEKEGLFPGPVLTFPSGCAARE